MKQKKIVKLTRKPKSKKKIITPIKISTNSSLSALTLAFFVIDLMSSNSNQGIVGIFQRDSKNKPQLVADHLYDQHGVWEASRIYQNGELVSEVMYEETIKKLEKLKEQKKGVKYYSDLGKLAEEIGFDFENLENIYKPMFQSSFQRASEILFWALFLERFFKLNTVQNVINFCYTMVRSTEYLPGLKALRRECIKKLGISWQWQITWEVALLLDANVKKRWTDEEKRGTAYHNQWKKECRRQANNNWNKNKHQIEAIKTGSNTLRKRLERKIFPVRD